jgi:hypothetical protein
VRGGSLDKLYDMSIPPSLLKPGFYYEKQGRRGWLRRYVFFHNGFAVWADFCGTGACGLDSFARWASHCLTEAEAREQFPEEVAKIDAILRS